MKVAGVEIKRGKHLAFKIPNGKKFVRCNSLGADYSETAIMEHISGKRIVAPRTKAKDMNAGRKRSISKRWQKRSSACRKTS